MSENISKAEMKSRESMQKSELFLVHELKAILSDEELTGKKNELPKQQKIEGISASVHTLLKYSNLIMLKQIIMVGYNVVQQEKNA